MTETQLNQWIDTNLFDGGKFVGLKKRGLWYRPNARGYTSNVDEAGRYTMEEAKLHEYPHDEPVTIHEFPVPDYLQPALALKVLKKCGEETKDEQCIYVGIVSGEWMVGHSDRGIEEYAETLELAIALFAKKLFTKQ